MTSTDDPEHDVADIPGSLPPEPVGNRSNVGSVSPDDYPEAMAGRTDASGSGRPAGRDDQMEEELLNPGSSSGSTPSEVNPVGKAGDGTRARQPFNGNEA